MIFLKINWPNLEQNFELWKDQNWCTLLRGVYAIDWPGGVLVIEGGGVNTPRGVDKALLVLYKPFRSWALYFHRHIGVFWLLILCVQILVLTVMLLFMLYYMWDKWNHAIKACNEPKLQKLTESNL